MEITDIPAQVAIALKYSLRSPGSFMMSLIGAIVVLGIAFDLLYAFFYTRLYEVKDPHYGVVFWIGLCFFGAAVPLVCAIISLVSAKLKMRPFPHDKFGIAIAPFEVCSLDPDTLATSTKLACMDEAMRQYFDSTKRACEAEHWLDDFEFRFLPSYVRFRSKQDATKLWKFMGATLVIWGEILQQRNVPLTMTQNLLGPEVDIKSGGPMELSLAGAFLAFYALSCAGYLLGEGGKRAEAVKKFSLAKDGPATVLDPHLRNNIDPTKHHTLADLADRAIQKYMVAASQ